MTRFLRSATAVTGAALLLAGCGDRAAAPANNSGALLTGSTNDFAIGNDASAMETVGSAKSDGPSLDMNGMGPVGQPATGNSAAPVGNSAAGAVPGGSAPGGDRGGNTVESNVAGM